MVIILRDWVDVVLEGVGWFFVSFVGVGDSLIRLRFEGFACIKLLYLLIF